MSPFSRSTFVPHSDAHEVWWGAKLASTRRLVKSILQEDTSHRILILSQWSRMLCLVSKVLAAEIGPAPTDGAGRIAHSIMTGNAFSLLKRLREFQSIDNTRDTTAATSGTNGSHATGTSGSSINDRQAPPRVLLLNLETTCSGLDLLCATHILLLDLPHAHLLGPRTTHN